MLAGTFSFPHVKGWGKRMAHGLIWWIIVGLIAGFLTGKLMRGSGYGVLGDIIVGIVGAVVGGFIMQALGHPGSGGLIYTVVVAIIGAVLLTWILRLISSKRTV
jgi:uncharacterized membrane protein YeaQ/YmgE (transglycosylase-associated protein family)